MNRGGFAPWRVLALHPRLLLGAIICAVILVYLPGLEGPFVFDDTTSITGIPAVALTRLDITQLIAAATANESGPLGRPLASLTFALNHYFAGSFDNTVPFKLTNLLIHVANSALIYLLLSRLRPPFESLPVLLVTAAWALHPIQLTSVLYVVQRMTSLSSTFVLVGLIVFVDGRRRLALEEKRGLVRMAAGLTIGLFGMLAKESSVLILLYALVIEFVVFDRDGLSQRLRRHLVAFYAVAVLLPVIALLIVFWDIIADSYAARDFTMGQRLLTESRVLWYYVRLIAAPSLQQLSLFHDDITISTGLLHPWTTAVAVAGLLACLSSALVWRRHAPVMSFAVLWFLAGHSLESSFIGLEFAHEHRNYLPSLGLLTGIFYAATYVARRFPLLRAARLLLVAFLGAITVARAHEWRSEASIIEAMAKRQPYSARATTMLAELRFKEGRVFEALSAYTTAIALAPNHPAIPLRLATVLPSIRIAQTDQNATGADKTGRVGKAPAAAAPALRLPDILARIPPGGDRLTLNPALVQHVAQQLATRPLDPNVQLALRSVAACLINDPCPGLAEAGIAWHQAVVGNIAASDRIRTQAAFDLFQIAMSRGDPRLALDAAETGLSLAPGSANFRLMRAHVLAATNRLDEAETELQTLSADLRLYEEHREAIDFLDQKLRRARAVSAMSGPTER